MSILSTGESPYEVKTNPKIDLDRVMERLYKKYAGNGDIIGINVRTAIVPGRGLEMFLAIHRKDKPPFGAHIPMDSSLLAKIYVDYGEDRMLLMLEQNIEPYFDAALEE